MQMAQHALAYRRRFDLRKLEAERILDVALLRRRHRTIKLPRLAVMISETVGSNAQLFTGLPLALLRREAAEAELRVFPWTVGVEAVGLIGDPPGSDVHPAHAVAL